MSDNWSFLTNHARALLFVAAEPEARLRDLAAALGLTERTAFAIVTDLSDAGYVVKSKEGRRNRYSIQTQLPLRDNLTRARTIGELLSVMGGTKQSTSARRGSQRPSAADRSSRLITSHRRPRGVSGSGRSGDRRRRPVSPRGDDR